jgi:sarcosine oxidase/L-pipecolate oxidase
LDPQSRLNQLTSKFDIIVVGGGPVGLASAYYSALKGKRVLVLDSGTIPNSGGSSTDLARMFRTVSLNHFFTTNYTVKMYSEKYMAKLALQAKKMWEQLEKDSGEELIEMSGLLNFGDPSYEDGPEVQRFNSVLS